MSAHSAFDAGPPHDLNSKIIDLIFLASDLAHSCDSLEVDQRAMKKELVRCANKSVSLLRKLLSEYEKDSAEAAAAARVGLYAISGGLD